MKLRAKILSKYAEQIKAGKNSTEDINVKSTLALVLARRYDHNFSVENVFFDTNDFIKHVTEGGRPGAWYVLDDTIMTPQKGDRKGEKSANKSRRGGIRNSCGVSLGFSYRKVVETTIRPRTMSEILKSGKKY